MSNATEMLALLVKDAAQQAIEYITEGKTTKAQMELEILIMRIDAHILNKGE